MEMIMHGTTGEVDDHGFSVRVPLTLMFFKNDPLAIHLTFVDSQGPVPWTTTRELITKGLSEVVGPGDIAFWPISDGTLGISLVSDDKEALIKVNHAEVKSFLEKTEILLPTGSEAPIIEQELDIWIEGIL